MHHEVRSDRGTAGDVALYEISLNSRFLPRRSGAPRAVRSREPGAVGAASCSATRLPTKPVPPVTRTVLGRLSLDLAVISVPFP
jgi:hypothetical protein